MKFVELREKAESQIREISLSKKDGEWDEETNIDLNELSNEEYFTLIEIADNLSIFDEELVDFFGSKNDKLFVHLEYSDAAYSSLEHLAQKLRIPVHIKKHI